MCLLDLPYTLYRGHVQGTYAEKYLVFTVQYV